ncbi:MAG: AI-2E family transporter [Flavitalea sp.]
MQQEARPFYFRASMSLLMLALICILLYYGSDIIVPFAFAVLLSILLVPLNHYFERKGLPRVYSIMVSLGLSFFVIGGIIYFLSTQILVFMEDIPVMRQKIHELIYTTQASLQRKFGISISEQKSYLDSATGGTGPGLIGTTVISLKDSIVIITLLPIYTFLILYYRDMLKKFLIDLFREHNKDKVEEVISESKDVIQNYMVGLMMEMGIVAILNFIGFTIIGIEYAVFLAVFAAILNLLPYIGMLIANLICVLVTLTTAEQSTDALWVMLVLAVVQFFDNNIMMPRIVGSKVKINALIAILAVILGGTLCGISGTFLAIPGIAILKAIFERIDDMKPWGMLLGDSITEYKPGKIYSTITSLRRKPRKVVENNAQPPIAK